MIERLNYFSNNILLIPSYTLTIFIKRIINVVINHYLRSPNLRESIQIFYLFIIIKIKLDN